MKTLNQQELNQIRDLVCEGLLTKGEEHKQYFLEEVLRIVTEGGLKEALDSAESQGYEIERGTKPIR